MKTIKRLLKRLYLVYYWKRRNSKEHTLIMNYSLSPKLKLGKRTRIRDHTEIGNISLGDYSYISGPRSFIEEAHIGKYCSIARQVVIGVSDHNFNWVTTSLIIVSSSYGFVDDNIKVPQKSSPVIGNDVWIGMNVIIMRGVTISDGAVVAAGSVVTTDVEPYSIVAGVPAKHIKYRFEKVVIEAWLKIKWWDWPDEKIRKNIHLFYDVEKFVNTHSILF
jgi:virginiamycin A acetyltransferase